METDHNLTILYFEKKLSQEEQQAFEEKMSANPNFRKEVDDMRFVWKMSAELKLHKQVRVDSNWQQLSRRIAFDDYRKNAWHFMRSAAAVLLIPVLIATFTLLHKLNEWENQPIEQQKTATAYGLVSKIVLSDGSEVWLNSGSQLSYPQRFSGDKRTVHLEGEAYFKVTSDKAHRFDVVTSDGLTVSAYGTEFNVNAYDDEKRIEATLAKGNIEVTQVKQSVTATPQVGQQVVFDKSSNQMKITDANLSVKTAWKDGKMVFRRASMDEIVRRLSRHFNVEIKLEGKELHAYEYSATFTTETLSEILQLLEKTAPITCQIINPEQDADLAFSKRTVIIRMNKE